MGQASVCPIQARRMDNLFFKEGSQALIALNRNGKRRTPKRELQAVWSKPTHTPLAFGPINSSSEYWEKP